MSGLTPAETARIDQDFAAACHEISGFITAVEQVTEDGDGDAEKWVLMCSEMWAALEPIPDGDPRARQFIIRLAAAAVLRATGVTR